jgi:hypothetical protein
MVLYRETAVESCGIGYTLFLALVICEHLVPIVRIPAMHDWRCEMESTCSNEMYSMTCTSFFNL